MRLTDIIKPDRILLGLRAADKAQALAEIAKRASAHLPIEASTILTALSAREKLGSTGFGRGFALPHVRIQGLEKLFGLLVRLAKPIEYEAIDGKSVDILFLLLIPVDKGNDHVAALAAVSRAMRDETTLAAVRKAGSAALLFDDLAATEA
ncbi:PTS sugar transporter subunit IIA [Acidisphaera sp. L21]|uniref:PTS sugar transporter subunit IIA n=1 Tax=Acidisphaera sp. L21 TaxID=1641851 RepID=UPI00131C514F|nr:PTS sugar transporter subunit IIA [Acidisphaera sp. L21]